MLFLPSQAMSGAPSAAHYAMSKAGLLGLLRTLSLDGRPHGINVNGVMPFAFTSMVVDLMASGTAGAIKGADLDLSEATARLDPAWVAQALGWLAHESCPITGEIVHAGGSRVSRIYISETPGYTDPALTPEKIRDNWSAVCEEANSTHPADCIEPLMVTMQAVGIAPPTSPERAG